MDLFFFNKLILVSISNVIKLVNSWGISNSFLKCLDTKKVENLPWYLAKSTQSVSQMVTLEN